MFHFIKYVQSISSKKIIVSLLNYYINNIINKEESLNNNLDI